MDTKLKSFLLRIVIACLVVAAIGSLYYVTGHSAEINWLLPFLLIGVMIYFLDRIYLQGRIFSMEKVQDPKTRKFLIMSLRALLAALIVAAGIYLFAQSKNYLLTLLVSFLYVEAYFAYSIYFAKRHDLK